MDFGSVPTPAYVVDEDKLIKNLEILAEVKRRSGCKILLAQKAFSCYAFYPLISQYLDGASSSGLYEARLAHEEFGGENHVFSPAFRDGEFDEIVVICDHIVFNSIAQTEKFYGRLYGVSAGLRINPEFSTQSTPIYDPCAPYSRLGVTEKNFDPAVLGKIEGFHIHTLCEQSAEDLAATVAAFEKKFGGYFGRLKWLNLGGGHHITREGYDIPLLVKTLSDLSQKYGLQVYIEPGEAVALNAGYLVSTVLEIVKNGKYIAVLDASAECHMPDVIEMPYRPPVIGAGKEGEYPYNYRLSSCTCLAGDVTGDYSFREPLKVGDRLVFGDMAIYTMVKNNTFNGTPLPAIVRKRGAKCEIIKEFGYSDFKGRLS